MAGGHLAEGEGLYPFVQKGIARVIVETRWPPDVLGITGTELERRPLPVQDLFCSPEDLLASLLYQKEDDPQLVLLTGPRGTGKTSCCLDLVAQAQTHKLIVGGLVSPPVFANGRKIAIDLLDVASGVRRRLAYHRRHSMDNQAATLTGVATDDWQFDPQVLDWGNGTLERLGDCDLFILDEVGPLEFLHHQGLQTGLLRIDARQYPRMVVVVRSILIPVAKVRWPWAQVLQIAPGREVAQI
jgi:nucleoside-triphosphatase THEP1